MCPSDGQGTFERQSAPMERPSSVQLYGKACLNCSKSKSKCVNQQDGKGCVRCHRLKIMCVSNKSVRKAAAQNNNTIDRIKKLESRFDGLVTALGHTGLVLPLTQASTEGGHANDFLQQSAESSVTTGSISSSDSAVQNTLECSRSSSAAVTPDIPADSRQCLVTFCRDMLKYFPFIHSPIDISYIRRERPFLLVCICAVGSRSTQSRTVLAGCIKKTVAERLLLDSQGAVNIDLLLGLLVFIAWGHDALLRNALNSLSRLTQLAMLTVFELRLNRKPTHETNMFSMGSQHRATPEFRGTEVDHTLEERRDIVLLRTDRCFEVDFLYGRQSYHTCLSKRMRYG
ncbi:hypothetical protein LIA77_00037 [Sarocladium implicatum]|nr:hypothetical protein LIA77_00037 [Sarocladium implicatum]